jgi:hypothetical protein
VIRECDAGLAQVARNSISSGVNLHLTSRDVSALTA